MASSSTSETQSKTVKLELSRVAVDEEFTTMTDGMSLEALRELHDEIQEEAKITVSKLKHVSEQIHSKEAVIKKEATAERNRIKELGKRAQKEAERSKTITFSVNVSWSEEPLEITLPKNTILSELRDDLATSHPSYEVLTKKGDKEAFVKGFVLMMDGNKIAGQGIMARPTLGGDSLKMKGGEVLSAFSASEFENRQATVATSEGYQQ